MSVRDNVEIGRRQKPLGGVERKFDDDGEVMWEAGGHMVLHSAIDEYPGDGEEYSHDYPTDEFDDIPITSQNINAFRRDHRPLFVEVYAGEGGLSRVMKERGFDVVKIDRPEWDLDQPRQRRQLLEALDRLEPEVVWCAPPCPLWSSLQDLNVKSDLDRELLEARRMEDHRSHLSLARRILLSQHRRGRIGVVEHPWGSRAWGTTAFRNLPGGKAKVDQCQYGAVLPDENGDPKRIRKRTRLQATPEGLAEKFTRVCPGGHQHLHLMGGSPGCPSRSKAAGAYQPEFCNGMADKMIEVFAGMSTGKVEGPSGGGREGPEQRCEQLAKDAVGEKDFSFVKALEIAEHLPLIAEMQDNGVRDGGAGVFKSGLWCQGGVCRIIEETTNFPWVSRFFNGMYKESGRAPERWTSFVIGKNVFTDLYPLVDLTGGGNHSVIHLGDHDGGELWEEVQSGEAIDGSHRRSYRMGDDGKVIPGRIVNTNGEYYELKPGKRYGDQEWKGRRWTIHYYDAKVGEDLPHEIGDKLRSCGYRLGECAVTGKGKRPKKSTRERLWKTARRLGALATWSAMAASTMIGSTLPPGREGLPAVILEVGGYEKTLEAVGYGYDVCEPLTAEVLAEEGAIEFATSLIDEVRPATLWIHGDNLHGIVDRVEGIIERQLGHGGDVKVKATTSHGFWEQRPWKEIGINGEAEVADEAGYQVVKLLGRPGWYEHSMTGGSGQEDGIDGVAMMAEGGPEPAEDPDGQRGSTAITFAPGSNIAPEVKSSLKRLHQNLGHPSVDDLARHLRFAGAGPEVIGAAKRLTCQVCLRCKRGGTRKPASPPTLLSFNQVVGVDIFSVYDTEGERYEMMSIIDYGTTYHVVGRITSHSQTELEERFCQLWARTFGPPGTIAVDLEGGLQAGLGRFTEWYGTRLRSAAGKRIGREV